jgi:hypothetical protein
MDHYRRRRLVAVGHGVVGRLQLGGVAISPIDPPPRTYAQVRRWHQATSPLSTFLFREREDRRQACCTPVQVAEWFIACKRKKL